MAPDRHSSSPDHQLRRYVAVLFRRKWQVIAVVLLVPAAAVGYSLQQPNEYRASAKVLVSRQDIASALTGTPNFNVSVGQDAIRYVETQAQLAEVPTVAARVLRKLHITNLTTSQFLKHSGATTDSSTDILKFYVDNGDPALAAKMATEFARQFTMYRAELDTAPTHGAILEVEKTLARLKAQGATHTALYNSLLDNDQKLRTIETLKTTGAFLIKPATSAIQIQPTPVRDGILGLMLGVVLGVGLAFLWDILDTRLRSTDEVAQALGLPLLARLPEPERRLRDGNRLVMIAQPNDPAGEAYRVLRTNVEFVNIERGARLIMVTSAVAGEGKSTTVANLAVAFARAGKRVALIDLDLRKPIIDRFFGLQGRPGITDVALGRLPLEEALVSIAMTPPSASKNGGETDEIHLSVLPAGTMPPDPGEFIGTRALADVLSRLRASHDVVFIDAPPLLQVVDALTLSSRVEGVLFVTRLKVLRRPLLNELRRVTETSGIPAMGFIATSAESESGYGYAYGYGYGHTGAAAEHPVETIT